MHSLWGCTNVCLLLIPVKQREDHMHFIGSSIVEHEGISLWGVRNTFFPISFHQKVCAQVWGLLWVERENCILKYQWWKHQAKKGRREPEWEGELVVETKKNWIVCFMESVIWGITWQAGKRWRERRMGMEVWDTCSEAVQGQTERLLDTYGALLFWWVTMPLKR